MIVMKKKKELIIRKIILIKIKGSQPTVLVKHRILSGVVLVLAHPVVVRVLLRRRGLADPQEVLVFRGKEMLIVLVLHFVIDAIIVILGSVDKVTRDVSLVVRWGIEPTNAHIISRNPSLLPYHQLFPFNKFRDLVAILRLVIVMFSIIREM